ncbi:hypothetical protein KOR42_54000 [Thalassoglobus neptunius]|uniref:Uncharacterized protein n=1 Tax=Thalassoglobus neptunius TaxID=1938619 RepID=A0A5C5UYX8_9PLAN|nr:hypothetical protein KOR42_54000 [Thalassoglobus neptunius]
MIPKVNSVFYFNTLIETAHRMQASSTGSHFDALTAAQHTEKTSERFSLSIEKFFLESEESSDGEILVAFQIAEEQDASQNAT